MAFAEKTEDEVGDWLKEKGFDDEVVDEFIGMFTQSST